LENNNHKIQNNNNYKKTTTNTFLYQQKIEKKNSKICTKKKSAFFAELDAFLDALMEELEEELLALEAMEAEALAMEREFAMWEALANQCECRDDDFYCAAGLWMMSDGDRCDHFSGIIKDPYAVLGDGGEDGAVEMPPCNPYDWQDYSCVETMCQSPAFCNSVEKNFTSDDDSDDDSDSGGGVGFGFFRKKRSLLKKRKFPLTKRSNKKSRMTTSLKSLNKKKSSRRSLFFGGGPGGGDDEFYEEEEEDELPVTTESIRNGCRMFCNDQGYCPCAKDDKECQNQDHPDSWGWNVWKLYSRIT
jgi:hypothetical protein